jgi:hypothetical protein
VVARRADEREPARLRGFDRDAGRELRGFPARLGNDRVRVVEPRRLLDLGERVEVLDRVDALDRAPRGRPGFARVRECLQQDADPLRRLGVAEGRV